jgi:hypothetical protein
VNPPGAAFVLLVEAMSAAAQNPPDAAPPSAALRNHLRGETFVPINRVTELPQGVRAALTSLFGTPTLEMAEPGAPFQATDLLVMPLLPPRRLIAAGCAADHCLVYYERGGYAHVHYVIVLARSGDTARLEWGGLAAGGLPSLEGARDALVSGKVLGETKYW